MSPVLRKFKLRTPIVLRFNAKRKARIRAETKAKRRGYKPSPEAIIL